MSVQALSAVLDHSQATHGARLTAISLANHADKNGLCFPSIKLAAQEAKLERRAVQEGMKKLKKLEELVVLVEADGATHRPPLYWIDLPGLSGECDDDHAYFQTFGPRADIAPGGDADSAPDPGADSAPGGEQDQRPPRAEDHARGVQNSQGPLLEEPLLNRQSTKKEGAPDGDAAFLQEIFEFWKRLTSRNGSTKFSDKRKRVIRMRLKDGHTPDEIRRAIVGCTSSDWHMKRGKHEKREGERHDDLTFILRSTENVERFAGLAGDTPAADAPSGPVVESAAAVKAWDGAKRRIAEAIPDSTFNIWIAPFEAAGERDGALVLVDTSGQGGISEWVRRRYAPLIRDALGEVADDYSDFEIIDETGLELEAA